MCKQREIYVPVCECGDVGGKGPRGIMPSPKLGKCKLDTLPGSVGCFVTGRSVGDEFGAHFGRMNFS